MSGDGFHQVRYKITKSFSKHNIFHKEIICFRKRFCNIVLKEYYCKGNNVAMFSDGKNNRYDLGEKCTISIYAAQILLFFSPSLGRLLVFLQIKFCMVR